MNGGYILGLNVPTNLRSLLKTCYRNIFPQVHAQLFEIKRRAQSISNEELRNQAIASIGSKTFHCEGGSIYATLARDRWKEAIQFIVSYQSISDYLDNLCDRSQSLDPDDFRLLHQSMEDALSPVEIDVTNYYALRDDQDDSGYLQSLVDNCQKIIQKINNYELIYPYVRRLASLYIDLQVHKHVIHHERVPRLTDWYEKENEHENLSWYEFAAASGSTLGIFCLISYALNNQYYGEEIFHSYFPYVQGLHIMLDYFIDQKEDEIEGDLNFCFYYPNEEMMIERIRYFINESKQVVSKLPHSTFHQLVQSGLLGLYLSDSKMNEVNNGINHRKAILKYADWHARVIYWNGRLYRKWKKKQNLDD